MSDVRLQELSKRFGSVVAVDKISLEVADGEMLALLGPSGCGKTTILRLLAGLELPDQGDILFAGQSVLDVPIEQRGVGLVFQNFALFPHMNVEKNIGYGLKMAQDRRRERISELVKLMRLTGLERRMPTELSAGQQQRVALARALAPDPRILLLDEPLSALDAQLRQRLRTEIKKIQKRLKITTVYVTHDQEEALAIADRIAVMKTARVEQVGLPVEIYQHPQTEFVARFIGRGNLFDSQLVSQDAGRVLLSVGEHRIWARRVASLTTTDAKLFIRPESIRIASATENELHGRITEIEFVGDRTWVYLQTTEGISWLALCNSDGDLARGAHVQFGFNSEDVYLLPG